MTTKAPWTTDQVNSLNAYQRYGYVHPYTSENGNVLIATKDGWVEEEDGPVVQDWAHEFSLDWSWNNTAVLKGHEFEEVESIFDKIDNLQVPVWVCKKCGERLLYNPKRFIGVTTCEEIIMKKALL